MQSWGPWAKLDDGKPGNRCLGMWMRKSRPELYMWQQNWSVRAGFDQYSGALQAGVCEVVGPQIFRVL